MEKKKQLKEKNHKLTVKNHPEPVAKKKLENKKNLTIKLLVITYKLIN
jgi:hypothetical protein